MASASLQRLPVQMLGDLVSPRALERILQDAAQARGSTLDTLDPAMLEDILKREVFKRLQLSVPAPLAKKRVSEVLNELMKTTQERQLPSPVVSSLVGLEEGARRFTLYFDWPETQRLRGVLSVARQEEKEGRDISALVLEGQNLIEVMDRRLQEGLVEQGQDLAELRATFARVQGMGGKEVRRLETLIGQIDEAQSRGTLLPGEVERARNITFNLRKLLESSVVQAVQNVDTAEIPTSATILDPDAQARVLALEQQHAAQQLGTLEREFAALLQARPDLRAQHDALRGLQHGNQLTADTVENWREQLKFERETVLGEQRSRLAQLETALAGAVSGADMRIALDSARHLLNMGSLATDELQELSAMHESLQAGVNAQSQLAAQRNCWTSNARPGTCWAPARNSRRCSRRPARTSRRDARRTSRPSGACWNAAWAPPRRNARTSTPAPTGSCRSTTRSAVWPARPPRNSGNWPTRCAPSAAWAA
ncbi:hypothetical protein ACFQDE_16485 [Deinococcus caeni]|uniref:hypothetical protein n=1 Tax=Deinococcus caeni TaxID=569127 RepID=UPI00361BA5CF